MAGRTDSSPRDETGTRLQKGAKGGEGSTTKPPVPIQVTCLVEEKLGTGIASCPPAGNKSAAMPAADWGAKAQSSGNPKEWVREV